MRTRFPRGSTAYAKDGRSYIVEEVSDGIVYCTTPSGAETEFPESKLMSQTEWEAKAKVGPSAGLGVEGNGARVPVVEEAPSPE